MVVASLFSSIFSLARNLFRAHFNTDLIAITICALEFANFGDYFHFTLVNYVCCMCVQAHHLHRMFHEFSSSSNFKNSLYRYADYGHINWITWYFTLYFVYIELYSFPFFFSFFFCMTSFLSSFFFSSNNYII